MIDGEIEKFRPSPYEDNIKTEVLKYYILKTKSKSSAQLTMALEVPEED
jgi:hypothetical protein